MKIKFFEYLPEPGEEYTLVLKNNEYNLTTPKEVYFELPGIIVAQDVTGVNHLYTESGECLGYRAKINDKRTWYIDIFGKGIVKIERYSQIDSTTA